MADDTQSAPVEAEVPDRREMLANALDAAEATQDAPAEETPVTEAPRGPDGKFAAAPATEAPEPVEEPLWKRPPASWKKDYHEAWSTADDKLKQYAWQREDEMRQGIEPLIPKAKFADQVQQAIEPFRANMAAAGVEPVAALSSLMQADHILRTAPADQKKAYALQLLSQYGIQLTPDDAYTMSIPPDPNTMRLMSEINAVRGEVQGWKERAQQEADAALQEEIAAFKKDKPDFDALIPVMQPLLSNGLVKDLGEAYQKARRLDDTAFQQEQEALQAKAIADKRAADDKAAKEAKAAAVSVRSSTPGARTPPKAQDRRSMLEEQFSNIAERF